MKLAISTDTYDDIWNQISSQMFYIPSHFTADPGVSDDIIDSNSTMTGVPAVNIEGTLTNTGANEGWFTGIAAGDTRGFSNDSAFLDFFRTDTLAVGQSIIFSFHIFVPAAGATAESGLITYGRGVASQPGMMIVLTSGGKITSNYNDGSATLLRTVGITSVNTDAVNHVLTEYRRISETEFYIGSYLNGDLDLTASDTIGSLTSITGGLNVYSRQDNSGNIVAPLEADFRMSDIIVARTDGDKSSMIAELAARQSRVRTSLVRGWGDVL